MERRKRQKLFGALILILSLLAGRAEAAEDSVPSVWVRDGRPSGQAMALVTFINGIGRHGLAPEMYGAQTIEKMFAELKEGKAGVDPAQLDRLLAEAFTKVVSDLSQGRIDPYTNNPRAYGIPKDVDLGGLLAKLAGGADTTSTLEGLLPKGVGYEKLQAELERMKAEAVKPAWPTVPTDGKKYEKIEPGAVDARIPAIRTRLEATGELKAGSLAAGADPNAYDDALVQAVKRFQQLHGLEQDGVIGKGTVDAMNVPAAKQVCKLKANLDRLRALRPVLAEKRFIFVNIPAFEVMVFEDGKRVLDMRAIVGRVDRKSPIHSDRVRFIVFSPEWYVPTSIAVKDKLPILKKDPDYLRRLGMKVYQGEGAERAEVDPQSIDWQQVEAGNFPYHFKQRPGDDNALGRVKFMFPNRYDVYLHDTSNPELFARQGRTLSSGCIRIAEPVAMAKYLLRDKPEWTDEKIDAAMKRTSVLVVNLTEPVPINLQYLTAWIDADGNVVLYNDVYGRDRVYERELCR